MDYEDDASADDRRDYELQRDAFVHTGSPALPQDSTSACSFIASNISPGPVAGRRERSARGRNTGYGGSLA